MTEDNLVESEDGVLEPVDQKICTKRILNMTDTIDILSGKWRVPIIILLQFEPLRFTEISKELGRITDRTLSKELRELEANLILKKLEDCQNRGVRYTLSDHGKSLTKILLELRKWGEAHREMIRK